jgi:tetratricopeptide (TPR) repeat protein
MSNGRSGYTVTTKRESGASALVQIVVVTALVGGGVFGWSKISGEKQRVAELAVKAKEATGGDDAPALLKARGLFLEIAPGNVEKVIEDDAILAAMAEIEAQLFFAYGDASAKAAAQSYVGKARERDLKKAERYAAEAYLLLGEGKANEAEAMLMDIVNNRGARHAKLLHALAVAKLQQGKAKDAVVAAQEGQKLSTQLARLPITEGDAYLALGNYAAAQNAYMKARKINPDHLRAKTAITIVAGISRAGKPELLVKELDRLLEEANHLHQNAPPPRVKAFIEYGKGELALVNNNAQDALVNAEAALTTDPGQAIALGLKGRALAKLGKTDDAKAAFDEALTVAPSSLTIARAAAMTMKRAGKAPEGLIYLQKVVASNPENGIGHAELSLFLSGMGKGKEAAVEAEEAIKILGNAHDLAVFAKARAIHADGQPEKALEIYKEALGYHGNPDWPELYMALGDVRMDEKNWEEAIGAYESTIKFLDKQGGSIDDVADAWELIGKANSNMGKKRQKEAKEAFDKAEALRKGKV